MRFLTYPLALIVLIATPSAASAAPIDDTVVVVVEPHGADVTLGEHLDLVVTITNTGVDRTPPLTVHVDITDPEQSASVDPEDWTATLSKAVGSLEPGATRTVDWRIQPISGGIFALYAVALSAGVPDVAASNVMTVDVTDQRSLNPNGILPVAIAAPAIVGALLLTQTRLGRRRRPQPTTA